MQNGGRFVVRLHFAQLTAILFVFHELRRFGARFRPRRFNFFVRLRVFARKNSRLRELVSMCAVSALNEFAARFVLLIKILNFNRSADGTRTRLRPNAIETTADTRRPRSRRRSNKIACSELVCNKVPNSVNAYYNFGIKPINSSSTPFFAYTHTHTGTRTIYLHYHYHYIHLHYFCFDKNARFSSFSFCIYTGSVN